VKPGVEEMEVTMKWRKRMEGELLRRKRKRAQMMEELEVGPSRVRGAGMMEGGVVILREIRNTIKAQNR